MMMKLRLTTILFGLSFFLNACGGSSGDSEANSALEIAGENYCDEANQVVDMSLAYHLTKTETNRYELYTSSILYLMNETAAIASGIETDEQIFSWGSEVQKLVQQKGTNALKDCEAIMAIEKYRQKIVQKALNNEGYPANEDYFADYYSIMSDKETADRFIYWTFLIQFLEGLDHFSTYNPPIYQDAYTYGIRTDVAKPIYYDLSGMEYPAVTVLGTQNVMGLDEGYKEGQIQVGDRIVAISVSSSMIPDSLQSKVINDRLKISDIIEAGQARWLYAALTLSPAISITLYIEREDEFGDTEIEEVFVMGRKYEWPMQNRPLVHAELQGNTIYVRLFQFSDGSALELSRKIASLQEIWLRQQAPSQEVEEARDESDLEEVIYEDDSDLNPTADLAILLDLRDNPGGDVFELHKIAGLFLPEVEVLSMRSRLGTSTSAGWVTKKISAKNTGTIFKNKLGVLINQNSASAADILTQILQETGRAVVIGKKSFGKGIGQQTFPLGAVSKLGGSFKITSMQFYGPSGDSPQLKGVEPDVEVEDFYVAQYLKKCSASRDCSPVRMSGLYDKIDASLWVSRDSVSSSLDSEIPEELKSEEADKYYGSYEIETAILKAVEKDYKNEVDRQKEVARLVLSGEFFEIDRSELEGRDIEAEGSEDLSPLPQHRRNYYSTGEVSTYKNSALYSFDGKTKADLEMFFDFQE